MSLRNSEIEINTYDQSNTTVSPTKYNRLVSKFVTLFTNGVIHTSLKYHKLLFKQICNDTALIIEFEGQR